jgi:hypothetical protein
MKKNIAFLLALLIMFSLPWAFAADVPFVMNYQGSVKTSAGTPYNGNGYFKFAIVNPAGDTTYWSNDGTSTIGYEPTTSVAIPVSDGLFSVKLGDTSVTNMTEVLSTTVFNNTNTYIRTWFSDDDVGFSPLSPDQQIASGAYAVKAQSAETAVSKTGDTMTGGLTVPSITAGDISATGSINATGAGLTLSCISKSISYSQAANSHTNLYIISGAGTESATTKYCGAGYAIFQSRCVSGGGSSTIHLTQAGIHSDEAICTYHNSGGSADTVYLQGRCCKGSW